MLRKRCDRAQPSVLSARKSPGTGQGFGESGQIHLADGTFLYSAFRPSDITLLTPLMFLVMRTASAFCDSVTFTSEDSETTPWLVSTLMSLPGMPFSVSRSALTLVVIQVS